MGMSETFPYVMPAKAGIQSRHYGIQTLDSRFRGNDGNGTRGAVSARPATSVTLQNRYSLSEGQIAASGLGWRRFQEPDDPRVRNHLKPLALATLQLDALRGNAGQQASTQTAVFVGLTRLLEYSNDAFLHFQSSLRSLFLAFDAGRPERSLR